MIVLRRSFAFPRFLPAAGCMFASLCCVVATSYCQPVMAQDAHPPFVVEDPPRSAVEQQKLFHLPEGFHIELVASEPEVINPINLNFDAAGNLYVSQSIEYPIPALGQPGRDAIQRVSSFLPGSGKRPQVETFADGLHIPIGLTAVPGGLLGFSVPQLYFFADANGDGVSEQREVRFGDFGFDDTHGMISSLSWWIDGWVYGCHGFVNTSEVAGSDGEVIKMVSGNTYRLRPDGSRIEQWAHGQVNPFGLTIDPWGNVFTSDCHTRPATHLLPGAHYPRSPGDGLGQGPELMQHSHGSTGIAGIVYYAAEQFPQAYRGSLFIGNPITGRINLDRLERHGSTYTAIEQADFLRCDDPWFRPVDIQLGPDGALYIADMYNCIIGHYEVPLKHPKRDRSHGRIWRVSYSEREATGAGSPASEGIDLTSAEIGQLVDALGDPNLIVRTLATHQLVMRGPALAEQAVRALLRAPTTAGSPSTPEQRAHALWVLKRWGAWANRDWQTALEDPSPLVRTHAVKALADDEGWDEARTAAILAALDDKDGFVQRAAVEGLARHPQPQAIEPLLKLLAHTDHRDQSLIHSARIALRNTLQSAGGFSELAMRLQGQSEHLRRLADVSVGIPTAAAAGFLWTRFNKDEFPEERRADVLRHVIRNIAQEELPEVVTLAESFADRDNETQIAVASALVQGSLERGMAVPESIRLWAERLIRPLLTSSDPANVHRGVELTTQMKLSGLADELLALCTRESPCPQERLPSILALPGIAPAQMVPLFFTFVYDQQEAPALRQFAAEKLANSKDPVVREQVLRALPAVPHIVSIGFARGLIVDAESADTLLRLVEEGKISPRVLQDGKIDRLLPHSGLADAVSRVNELVKHLPSMDLQKEQLIRARLTTYLEGSPDVARGEAVFKKTCAACHQLDNQGQKVGPELDGVGQRGLDRLLEDILDPDRTVDQNYRATVVQTVDGQVFTGLATGEEGQLLVLADQTGKLQQIPLADIEQRRRIEGSAMPANFDEVIPAAEFNDLLAFLLSKSVKKESATLPPTNTSSSSGVQP